MADTTHKASERNRFKIVGCVLSVLFVIVLCGGWTLVSIIDILNQPPAAVRLHNFTESLLQAIIANPNGPIPEEFSPTVYERCWDLIKNQLEQHDNDYTVTVVSVVGAGGTPVVGTDTTAAYSPYHFSRWHTDLHRLLCL